MAMLSRPPSLLRTNRPTLGKRRGVTVPAGSAAQRSLIDDGVASRLLFAAPFEGGEYSDKPSTNRGAGREVNGDGSAVVMWRSRVRERLRHQGLLRN